MPFILWFIEILPLVKTMDSSVHLLFLRELNLANSLKKVSSINPSYAHFQHLDVYQTSHLGTFFKGVHNTAKEKSTLWANSGEMLVQSL